MGINWSVPALVNEKVGSICIKEREVPQDYA